MPKSEEKMNTKCPDLLCTQHEELLKTPRVTSPCIQPAEPSLATTYSNSTSSQSPLPSIRKEQSEPQKTEQITLEELLPEQSSTEDTPNVKYPQSQDSSANQQQRVELALIPVVQVETLQNPALSPACLRAESPAGLYNWIFFSVSH